jgi:uncharacterized protein (DUF4415 family)
MNMTKIKMSELSPLLDDQELKELDAAASKAPVFDDDSPELTEEDLAQFKRINHAKRNKQTASIRLSEKAQIFSRSYGKGYTSFLSRLIDAALDDPQMVKNCL